MKFVKLSVFVAMIMFCTPGKPLFAIENVKQPLDSAGIQQTNNPKPMVVSARSLKEGRPNGSALIGDNIEVKVSNLRSIYPDSLINGKTPVPIYLVIDGSICKDIVFDNINLDKQSVFFTLDTSFVTLKKIGNHQPHSFEKSSFLALSISINGKNPIDSNVNRFKLYFTPPYLLLKGVCLFAFIIFIIFLLAKYSYIMRIEKGGSPFSLAQAQLTFWTVVVAISVLFIWFFNQNLPDLTPSILAILGISAATSVGSKFISDSSTNNNDTKVLPHYESKGFFQDILSDNNNNTNIHRFQMVVWTIILGIIFLLKVLTDRQLYNFDETYLVLMGISSGAYVILKTSENKEPKPANPITPGTSNSVASDPKPSK